MVVLNFTIFINCLEIFLVQAILAQGVSNSWLRPLQNNS